MAISSSFTYRPFSTNGGVPMLERLIGWSVEYRNWGWNLLTFTTIATFFFAVLQASMTFRQGLRIRTLRNGISVSVAFFGFRLWTFASILIYGWYASSLAILANGFAQTTAQAYVMLQLIRYKKDASAMDWRIAKWCALLLPFMIISGGSPLLIAVIMLTSLFPLVQQNYELFKSPTRGALSGSLIAALNAASFFWTMYGLLIWDFAVIIPSLLAWLLYIVLAVQYLLRKS